MSNVVMYHDGKPVTFHQSPLAGVPDFPWVDILQLAAAFGRRYPDDAIIRLCQSFPEGKDLVRTVRFEGRIITIVAHPIAQGLVGALDQADGASEADDGPRHSGYTAIAARAMSDHFDMPMEDVFAAFRRYNSPEGGAA